MIRLLLLVPAAFAAWALWFGEVMVINGEKLSPFAWSALPIAALIVGLTSVVLTARASWRYRLAFIVSNFCVILGAFVVARGALLQFFAIGIGPMRVRILATLFSSCSPAWPFAAALP